ncbi:hypothetical protein J3458_011634 [Metarhizium acridum]|uniref:uncharacterized protein n=1 Tax=Metarhizium acridum TaxID=92637 RepID=UPI001C6C7650|nr:hypothetical protein J3458_011634 [Metarhizium acridum]
MISWNDCQRIEAKRWLEQSSGHQYSRNSDATDEPKCMVSYFLTPRDSGRTRVGYAAQRLTTVAGELTKRAGQPHGPVLLYTWLVLLSLTLFPAVSAQLNFTPQPSPLTLAHNCLGNLVASFTDATPEYFANRAVNRISQLPYEFGGSDAFATFVSSIPSKKQVLVDLAVESGPECNHVALLDGYWPITSWLRRSTLRYSVVRCQVKTRAMSLRQFLLDNDLQDVEFHASGGPPSSGRSHASAQ